MQLTTVQVILPHYRVYVILLSHIDDIHKFLSALSVFQNSSLFVIMFAKIPPSILRRQLLCGMFLACVLVLLSVSNDDDDNKLIISRSL